MLQDLSAQASLPTYCKPPNKPRPRDGRFHHRYVVCKLRLKHAAPRTHDSAARGESPHNGPRVQHKHKPRDLRSRLACKSFQSRRALSSSMRW